MPNTDYALQITTIVQDLRGNWLDQSPVQPDRQPFVSQFRTAAAIDPTVIDGGYSISKSRGATLLGNTLIVTDTDASDFDSRIRLFDISDPTAPVQLSEIDPHGQPRAIAVLPRFQYLGLNGVPTFPQAPAGGGPVPPAATQPAGALAIALVFKRAPLDLGTISATYLQFYDLRDPKNPAPVGRNLRLVDNSIGTRLQVVDDRIYIKLADNPNPGLAIVDLRLALVKATLLPAAGTRRPDGTVVSPPGRSALIDAPCPTTPVAGQPCQQSDTVADWLGYDAIADGDFGDPGDWLPDIRAETDIVVGRVVTPGDTTDFAVSSDNAYIFVADG